ncbi:MAG: serine/threonine protein kinase [Anaerolineae bacterium]|nr:serine/threonine protein kinase [Gloeobacterales cyanobacterium ES-bin-313]
MALSLPSRLLQRYCLVRLLGSNGERRTWLATDEQTGSQITLKTLYFGQDLDWQQFEPFERELQILPKLDHPLIPKFLDTFWLEEPEGHYFCIVQQFVPGASLAERLTKGGRFDRAQVEALARDLLGVLNYLQTQDPPLVHRDIKPSNLIWGDDQKVHLIDFGAAQVIGQEGRTLTVAGTFGYMAPEQFIGWAIPASDLYSLGATLIQLLTGLSPRDLADSAGNLHLPKHSSLSGWLGYWLEQMVEPELTHRFSTASEALVAFEKKQEGIVVSCEPPLPSTQRFIVEECNEERLRVTLSSNSNTSANYRTRNYWIIASISMMVNSVVGFWVLNDEFGFLGAGSALVLEIILAIFCSLSIVPRVSKIKIGDGQCELNQTAISLPIQHIQFPLKSQVELLVFKRAHSDNLPEKTPEITLLLQDKASAKSVQFKVHIKETELEWLLKQFRMRKDQFNSQPED